MFTLDPSAQSLFRDAVARFAASTEVRAAVHALYQRLADATEIRRPVCDASGRCCNFEEFGHRLYATTMEFAAFVGDLTEREEGISTVPRLKLIDVDLSLSPTCSFQIGQRCTVHPIRPFGCRVYFCDRSSTDWQSQQYESFQALIREAHDRLAVPYLYVEWTQGLKILGLSPNPVTKA